MQFVIALLFAIVAAAAASSYGPGYYGYGGYDYGFDKPRNFARERKVNYVNGQRQARVNNIAESVQASSGTFDRDGVPGTGVGGRYYNRRAYDYYPGNYGYQNYY